MCLFAAVYRILPECPLLILANREEARNRPSLPPQLVQSDSEPLAWLGGRDGVAGGTWLGLNAAGLVAAVTNRPKSSMPAEPRSRGLLCRDLLGCMSADEAREEASRQLSRHKFNGFNALMLEHESGFVLESADRLDATFLTPGIHVVTNGPLNDPRDRRIRRVRAELEHLRQTAGSLDEWIIAGQRICSRNEEQDAMADDRGTVSSTLIALTNDPSQVRYLFADGPPSNTPYEEYSHLARQLFAGRSQPFGPNRSGSIHRIHLRGPWDYEWLSTSADSRIAVAPAGRMKMPASWRDRFGEAAGTVRFRRRFHRPTNLEPRERVFLVFDGIGGRGSVSL
ncbi:MAG: NRDE family protein, partial [Planctomycetaceae bacterium]